MADFDWQDLARLADECLQADDFDWQDLVDERLQADDFDWRDLVDERSEADDFDWRDLVDERLEADDFDWQDLVDERLPFKPKTTATAKVAKTTATAARAKTTATSKAGSRPYKPKTTTIAKTGGVQKKHHKREAKEDLLAVLRKFAASEVKISKEKTTWAKKIAEEQLERLRVYFKKNSGGIFSHFEYTGSFYEHLKTMDADELDIMIALDVKMEDFEIEDITPGYARLKVSSKARRGGKYDGLVVEGDCLSPNKVRRRFFGWVQKSVNEYKTKEENQPIVLKPSENGPAITLVIQVKDDPTKTLSIDLVPAVLLKDKSKEGDTATRFAHYVAKPHPATLLGGNHNPLPFKKLWRQSFSIKEKHLFDKIDKTDNGCRRELIRIVKTIVKKDKTLAQLSSYHIKSAFLHYNFGNGGEDLEWSGRKLPERFLDFLSYLRDRVRERRLNNYFIEGLNLLAELTKLHINNIDGRLCKIIQSEQERAKILKPVAEDGKKDKKSSEPAKKNMNTPSGHG